MYFYLIILPFISPHTHFPEQCGSVFKFVLLFNPDANMKFKSSLTISPNIEFKSGEYMDTCTPGSSHA